MTYLSPFLVQNIHYLRCSFLIKIGEKENVESPEKNENRVALLKLAEESLRSQLK
jgi:hypothetical protein